MRILPLVSRALLILSPYFATSGSGQETTSKLSNVQEPQATQEVSTEQPTTNKSIYRIKDVQASQINGTWGILYTIQYLGDKKLDINASEISVEYTGENYSNSRSRPHAIPRSIHIQKDNSQTITLQLPALFPPIANLPFVISTPVKIKIPGEVTYEPIKFNLAEANPLLVNIIDSSNEKIRCREKVGVGVLQRVLRDKSESGIEEYYKPGPLPLTLNEGDTFQINLTLEHDHFLYGKYDPLFGTREIVMTIGPGQIYDTQILDHELSPAKVIPKLSTPPKERILDTEELPNDHPYKNGLGGKKGKFLVLYADVPGYQYFRFDDLPVRFGDTFKLSFDYVVAHGTEGTCHTRTMEYQDTPNAWYRLEGGFDEQLTGQGKWQRFEHTFRLLNETTTMALDFRIVGANVGDLYIDMNSLKLINLSAGDTKSRRLLKPSKVQNQ